MLLHASLECGPSCAVQTPALTGEPGQIPILHVLEPKTPRIPWRFKWMLSVFGWLHGMVFTSMISGTHTVAKDSDQTLSSVRGWFARLISTVHE